MANSKAISRSRRVSRLLEAVFTLCYLDDSIDDNILDKLIHEARLRGARRVSALRPNRPVSVNYDTLGHVIYRWQRDLRYMDEDGKSFPIPACGPAPSVEALFKEIRKGSYFDLGLKHLKQLRRIQKTKDGKFLPRAEVTIVYKLTPELVELMTQTINRLVATVAHNTSLRERKSVRLIERVTAVPDLPKKQIPAFKRFALEQGGALINTMNDWLESRRGTTKPRRIGADERVTAGLHVFGFVEKS